MADTDDAEKTQQQVLQNEVAHAISADLGRMVRSDVTRLTEMIAKYAGLPDSYDALVQLVRARTALLEFSAVTAGMSAPSPGNGAVFGPDVRTAGGDEKPAEEKAEPWDGAAPVVRLASREEGSIEIQNQGRDVLLTDLLVRGGFVSSSARAKVGIREGQVRVDGAVATNVGALVPTGQHSISVGDGGEQSVVVR